MSANLGNTGISCFVSACQGIAGARQENGELVNDLNLWRVQSWQLLNHRSAEEQMLPPQQQLVVVLLRGMSRLHVSEPSLLCAVPSLVCLLLQRGLTSHLPACDLKL